MRGSCREGCTTKRSTHLVSGIAAGAVIGSFVGGDIVLHMAVGAAFGVLPDLDLLFSGFGRRVHRSPASHSLLASALMAGAWALSLAVAPGISGLDHLSSWPISSTAAVAFLASLLHAAEDSMTLYGCKLLFPLSSRTFRGPVRYDDLAANLGLVVLALFVIVISLQLDLSRSI